MTDMDGLAQMETRRREVSTAAKERAQRQAPLSKSASRDIPKPDHVAPAAAATPPGDSIDPPATRRGAAAKRERQPAAPPKESPAASTKSPKGDLTRLTIYVDDAGRETLSNIAVAALRKNVRITLNSGVVRLALERLMSEMTPEQIVDVLAQQRDDELAERARRDVGSIGGRPRF